MLNRKHIWLQNNSTFTSLEEDDKQTFLCFLNHDEVSKNRTLELMIDLVERNPAVREIDVKEARLWSRLFESEEDDDDDDDDDDRLYAVHILILFYGKPHQTEVEISLALNLLKKLKDGCWICESGAGTSLNIPGIDWIPSSTGWSLAELSLVCGCHSKLIEYLVEEALYNDNDDSAATLLLSAVVLGQQVEVAKGIATASPCAFLEPITVRSKHYGEWTVDVTTSVFEVLFSKPEEEDWVMDLLDFFFSNYENIKSSNFSSEETTTTATDDDDDLCINVTHENKQTASKRKALLITKYLLDRPQQESFEMIATNWSVDGLCCLMTGLESNPYISSLDFAIPERMMYHGNDSVVRTGFTRMIRNMKNLKSVTLDLGFRRERQLLLSSNNNESRRRNRNHVILDAFIDALPNSHVKEVCLSPSEKEIMSMGSHRSSSGSCVDDDDDELGSSSSSCLLPLCDCPSLQRLLNRIVVVDFRGMKLHCDVVTTLVKAILSESSSLQEVEIESCEIIQSALQQCWNNGNLVQQQYHQNGVDNNNNSFSSFSSSSFNANHFQNGGDNNKSSSSSSACSDANNNKLLLQKKRTKLEIRECWNSNLSLLDCLGQAFHDYSNKNNNNTNLGTFIYTGSPSTGLYPLISRSIHVTLCLRDFVILQQDDGTTKTGVKSIDSVWHGIQSASRNNNLEKLCLNFSFHSLPKESIRLVYESITFAISNGTLIHLSCPLSLIVAHCRHCRSLAQRRDDGSRVTTTTTTLFDGWERLEKLDLRMDLKNNNKQRNGFSSSSRQQNNDDDLEVLRSSGRRKLGNHLIAFMERSKSLTSLRTTGFVLEREQAMKLRHMMVCKYAGLSQVCDDDVHATLETVTRVVSRVTTLSDIVDDNNVDWLVDLTNLISSNVNKEDDYEMIRVSATYNIIRESAGIIANRRILQKQQQ